MPNIDTSQMLPTGTMLHDNAYRIDSYLASGGFGNTYLATNIAFDEKVAIKEFFLRGQSERTDDMLSVRVTRGQELFFDEQKRKFVKEAQRIRRLRNPHIVRVHDLFEANGTAYYVMDYIDGESVAARLKRTGKPFSEDETHNILTQVLEALTEVHEAGIYHLDIKPDNILLDRKGNACLIDFGASKLQSHSGDGVSRTSAFAATPEYAPLELTDGNTQNIGSWSDIYSLGATAYRMVTGAVPPRSSEVVITGTDAFRFTDAVSQTMQKFISTCMAGDYRKRPQTAAAAIEMLNVRPQVVVQPKPQVVERPKPQIVEQPKPQPKPVPQPSRDSDATKVIGEEHKKVEPVKSHKSYGAFISWSLIVVIFGSIIYMVVANSGRKIESNSSNYAYKHVEEIADESTDEVAEEVAEEAEEFDEAEEVARGAETLSGAKETFSVNGVLFTMIRVEGNGNPYYIGETEVTQELWQTVMGSNPSFNKGNQYPVESVNCNDCDEFIHKLNSNSGYTFRLPSEDEWEYAAKGGEKTHNYLYSGSDDIDEVAWFESNSYNRNHDVGTKRPNELGIYDMSGNVWEWTSTMSGSYRMARGGSWHTSEDFCTVGHRSRYTPTNYYSSLGLRLAL